VDELSERGPGQLPAIVPEKAFPRRAILSQAAVLVDDRQQVQ
jgi:hypothetical protein